MISSLRSISIFIAILILLVSGCDTMKKENSIQQELLRPVNVSVSGNVISSDTELAVSGIEVRIIRILGENPAEYVKDDAGTELKVTTDASGNFAFSGFIKLNVDTYQHFLELKDPSNNYYTNDAMVIYSIRDAKLEYKAMRLISKNPKVTTIVRGTVKNVLSDAAVAGAAVKLTQGETVFSATSAADGTFSIESVPVSEYKLKIDASTIAPNFVIEESTVKLIGAATNELGSLRIAPAIGADDLRVVLQWNESANMDLDIQYTFPKPTIDFNHLGTKTYDIGSGDFSMNPAYGFAKGTAYWPENMGGEARAAITDRDEPGRYTLDKNAGTVYSWSGNIFSVGGKTIAELDRNSINGSTPEVLTIHKQNFLSIYPSNLSYYYNYLKSGVITKFFPAALGVFSVKNSTANASIYNSGAVVKVYQGNLFLGKFSVSDLAVSAGESNKTYWTVLQIEQGYTSTSPASADDLYFRVVSYNSQSPIPSTTPPDFFFNIEGLPRDKTYTAYDDLSTKIEYSSSPFKQVRAAGTEDGYVYSMFQSYANAAPAGTTPPTNDFKWRIDWHGYFPNCKVTSVFLDKEGMFANIFLGNVPGSAINNGYEQLASDYAYTTWTSVQNTEVGNVADSDEFGNYYQPSAWSSSGSVSPVYDFVLYYDANAEIKLNYMAGTADGPRNDTSLSNPWGAPAAVPTAAIKKICPVVSYYKGLAEGRVLCAGDNNLWMYNSNLGYNHIDSWTEVKDSNSSSIVNVRAMAAITSYNDWYYPDPSGAPLTYYNNEAFVAKYDSVSQKYIVGKVHYNTTTPASGVVKFYEEYWDGNKKINDIKILKFGYTSYVFFATDNGVWYRNKKHMDYYDAGFSGYNYADNPAVKLSPLLDGIEVLKIIDYDGKIGLLTRNNGIIVGPYPSFEW